ncbi:unnamed protein product [Spirodela intermedia]|uniref:Uncharacterized protein n=1 Tax=Spirodela intermedia TaxID=51605 RepID=A0A7I8KA22_SPIIN|nr:unnamed protein product [Spirodela intermedia]
MGMSPCRSSSPNQFPPPHPQPTRASSLRRTGRGGRRREAPDNPSPPPPPL